MHVRDEIDKIDGRLLTGSTSTNTLRVVALLEHTVDTADGELETSAG